MTVGIGEQVPDVSVDYWVRGAHEPKQMSLSDHRGKWVVLFFYPRDFTFICPTEIAAYASMQGQFESEDAVIIGASTDSFFSHKAWFETEERLRGVRYPVLADTFQRLTRAFGILLDDGSALRGTYIIDPEGRLRHMSVNDLDVGRSVGEPLRILQALRTGQLCPADWRPGEETLTTYNEWLARAFPRLPKDVLAGVSRRLQTVKFEEGQIIIRQGDEADRFYIIVDGEVAVIRKTDDGAEMELAILCAGDVFGEMGILTETSRSADVRARTKVELLALGWADFKGLLVSSDATAMRYIQTVDQRRKSLQHLALVREAVRSRDELVALHRELDLARQLQQSILPRRFPQSPAYELYADMSPATEVGGDFYDFFEVGPGRVALAIADVSGKGMAAALFMAVARTVLRSHALAGLPPGACLRRVNDLLCDGNEAAMFVTLFYGILDLSSGELVYANGGHNPPYRIAADGQVMGLEPTGGLALAVMPGTDYAEKVVAFGPGDGLFLYTDGITEALDRQGNEFGDARLVAALRQSGGSCAREMLERVTAALGSFAGDATPADDVTCLALRYGGAGMAQGTAPQADAPAADPGRTTAHSNRLCVMLENRPDEIGRLASLLEGFGEANGLSPKLIFDLSLSFDELLTNIISYGYDDDAAHEIAVSVTLADDLLTATLEDEAKPFDPLTASQPDLGAPLERRPVGGLGIHIVKTLMDDVAYERRDGRNRLVMRKAV